MTGRAQMVVLGCGGELFAVPVARVQEILDLCPISRLPHTPPHLLGLIDVRGESVAVADLRCLLGQPPATDSAATRIIVLLATIAGQRKVIALRADQVLEVAELDEGTLGPVPDTALFDGDAPLIAGIGRRNGRFVTVLDPDRMFPDLPGAKGRAA